MLDRKRVQMMRGRLWWANKPNEVAFSATPDECGDCRPHAPAALLGNRVTDAGLDVVINLACSDVVIDPTRRQV